jgi:hypothetical protein
MGSATWPRRYSPTSTAAGAFWTSGATAVTAPSPLLSAEAGIDHHPAVTRTHVARQMSLSEHTVQDHLKSIFAKTDSRDRITLFSRALGTRLSDVNDRSVTRGNPAPD